jgi:hypothetical protein
MQAVTPETDRSASVIIPTLPVEEVPPGENGAIDKMITTLHEQICGRYPPPTTALRDAHPKHHGLVKALFTVDEECPVELRHGLFVPSAQYKAQIRFSNGDPIVKHDLSLDLLGIAIKLSGVEESMLGGNNHDFLLATGKGFFGKDAVDFTDFPAAAGSKLRVIWHFVKGRRLRGGRQLLRAVRVPASPLAVEYFSQTPYRLGPHVVKYHVRPSGRRRSKGDPWYLKPLVRHMLSAFVMVLGLLGKLGKKLVHWVPGFDALRDSLARDLKEKFVKLDFLIQRWPDLSQLPVWAIEDPTRPWTAPWVKAATIYIYRQTDIRARDQQAEHMSFTPWRAHREHQPLGGINRARLRIYSEMAAFRNELNARPGP